MQRVAPAPNVPPPQTQPGLVPPPLVRHVYLASGAHPRDIVVAVVQVWAALLWASLAALTNNAILSQVKRGLVQGVAARRSSNGI